MKKVISSKSAKIKAKRRLQRGVYFPDYVQGALCMSYLNTYDGHSF